ncbi:PREDICTED: frizzled-10-like [Nicrophorus vespilloides]|uniref:Frizzled-10-like n=1 Tax=Nicrophorus vespilloides TaxID=110193 RepID=A0ABM1MMX6_NICVS|nr:PREDICTED: frizzled-10-like [Nicrophorus vespilloides]
MFFVLQLEEFNGLLAHKCSPFLRLFVCSVYVPLCSEDVPGAVPACRGLCEDVRKDCMPALEAAGLVWPSQLNCSRFPEPPDLCMQKRSEDELSSMVAFEPSLLHQQRIKVKPCPQDTVLIGDRCTKICVDGHEEDFVFEVWIAVWSILSIMIVTFALLTFAIQPKRFRWPARPILYLTICGFVTSLTYLVRWLAGSLTCSGGVKPFDNWLCVNAALLGAFCDCAYCLWWCTFSYVWYLSASKEWSTEAIERIAARLHSIVWTLSVCPIVYALVFNAIVSNPSTGFCETSSDVVLFVELGIVICGMALSVSTSLALRNVKKTLVHAGRSPYKLERLIYRLGLISFGISVPLLTHLIAHYFDLEYIAVGAKFSSVIFSTFWVFSYKTFRSWNKVLRPNFTHKGLRQQSPVTKV